jgi:hypothetical protein
VEQKLLEELVALRLSNERAFMKIGELSQLIKDSITKIAEQETRIESLEKSPKDPELNEW